MLRFFASTLELLTNAHVVHGRLVLKDVIERFWIGLVHELNESHETRTVAVYAESTYYSMNTRLEL